MKKVLRLLISVSLLGWLAWHVQWQQVQEAFARLRVAWWLAAVGLYLATQVVSSLRWQLLARPLGFERSLRQYTGFYFVGMYFNLILPTSVGGDVVRAWYLDGRSGRRLLAFVSVFVDRLSGLLVLLAMACVAAALCPIALPVWVRGSVWGTAACAVLALLTLPRLTGLTNRLTRLRRLADSIELYRHQLHLLLSTAGLSLAVQAANVILVWLIGRAIAAPVPGAYYWILVPMVTLLTLLPLSVNGMGIREGGMVLFLTPLGVDEGTAVGLAFLWFLVFTVTGLCGGAVYLFGCFPRPEVQSDHEPVGNHSHQGRARESKTAA